MSPEYDLLGFDLTRPLDREEADEVLGWLDTIDQPAPRNQLLQEIARCLTVTASRAKDEADIKGMMAILTDELASFPADIVASELRSWARREKWWPTLSELRDRCQQAMRVRKSLRHWCGRDAFGLVKVPA